jgi:hypothetical protein
MNPPASLTGAHLRTYNTIFQHPLAHSLGWHDVHALFRQLGRVEEQLNGNFKVTRNGHTLVLPHSHQKDISEADDLMRLRHFLEHTVAPAPGAGATAGQTPWLLVINHHEARIFRSFAAGTAAVQIQPPQVSREAHGYSGLVRGQEKPSEHTFFAPIAEAVKEAGQILVFGGGTGAASESAQFIAWAKVHHTDLAGRIAGAVVIDEHHLTDTQLLAKARDYRVNA